MLKLIVSGRVGADAQLKTVGDTTVCSFSVALSIVTGKQIGRAHV